jgi:drug/metabolite transporter (DMT)-like permease
MLETLFEAVAAAVITIVFAPVVAWFHSLLAPKPAVEGSLKVDRESHPATGPKATKIPLKVGQAAGGFGIAILAAAIWGVANAATRFSAEGHPDAIFEIGIVQFIAGSISVLLVGLLAYTASHSKTPKHSPSFLSPWLILSSILMAINTCLFTAAVSFVNAGAVAVLENMQVIWIALILTLFLGVSVPARWFFSAAIVIFGTLFVLEAIPELSDAHAYLPPAGIACGLGAGLSFAAFNLTWAKARDLNPDANFGTRTLEMAAMLTLTTCLIVPAFFAFKAVSGADINLNLLKLPMSHIAVQLLVGAFSVGATYVLMNEAFELLKGVGDLRVMIVGLGTSYAVLFTLVSEYAIFGRDVSFVQWIGVVLFSLGFMMVWRDVSDHV